MSQILDEIKCAYPSLANELSSLPADEASDSRYMVELASYVVDLFETGRAEDIRATFEFAEHLISTGSEGERHAAIVGFLETVQNVASHRKCGSAAFEQFLGPTSQRAWAELMDAWKGKTSLAEVLHRKPERHSGRDGGSFGRDATDAHRASCLMKFRTQNCERFSSR